MNIEIRQKKQIGIIMKKTFLSKLNSKISLALIIISGVGFLYFFITCFYDIYRFLSLSSSVPASNVHLKIFENSDQNFQIEADFSYTVSDTTYKQKEILREPVFDNPYQVKKSLESKINQDFLVYYGKKDPQEGTLQKEFSIKKLIDFFLSLGVFLYFLFIKDFYLQNFFKKNSHSKL